MKFCRLKFSLNYQILYLIPNFKEFMIFATNYSSHAFSLCVFDNGTITEARLMAAFSLYQKHRCKIINEAMESLQIGIKEYEFTYTKSGLT